MFKYTIIVEKTNGNYSAYCPNLPGCVAMGKTIEETIQNMKEAIKFLKPKQWLSCLPLPAGRRGQAGLIEVRI